MRVARGVPARVQAVLGRGREASRALLALVRFFPRMDTLMFRQVALLTEALAAYVARERFYPCFFK